jgi:hypothetical protein
MASNLSSGDTNSSSDVFTYNRLTSATQQQSVDSSGAEGSDNSGKASLSDDGRFVAFYSANQLDSLAGIYTSNVYIRDTKNSTTQVISRNATYSVGQADQTDISADGSSVVFHGESRSAPYKYVVSDSNGYYNIYSAETGF